MTVGPFLSRVNWQLMSMAQKDDHESVGWRTDIAAVEMISVAGRAAAGSTADAVPVERLVRRAVTSVGDGPFQAVRLSATECLSVTVETRSVYLIAVRMTTAGMTQLRNRSAVVLEPPWDSR